MVLVEAESLADGFPLDLDGSQDRDVDALTFYRHAALIELLQELHDSPPDI